MAPPSASAESHLDVDYVLVYRYSSEGVLRYLPSSFSFLKLSMGADKNKTIAQFQELIRALADVGLETEVRNGEDSSLLVFVKAADEKVFGDVVYRSRHVYSEITLNPI
jgi:anoctamin-10